MTTEARKVAQERIEIFTNSLLKEIEAINPGGIDSFTDPGLQSSLFQAQKDVARTGDQDVAALLIDLIVMRMFHNKRSLEQIVIDEAITVTGKITRNQMIAVPALCNKGTNPGIQQPAGYDPILRHLLS